MFLTYWRDRLARLGRDVDPLPVPMSRRDIADHLGLTVETVCRTLAKLERRGAIEILPGRIRLLDTRIRRGSRSRLTPRAASKRALPRL